MAKKKPSALMTPGEQIAGTVFFMIYLLVLPFAADPLFRLAGNLLGISFSRTLESVVTPFVEEVLFRGLVFGNLRSKRRVGAYAASCLLFALLHVWQFAVTGRDGAGFLLMLQYLVPGLVLAWVYERSGTLWTAIALHAGVNVLSVWT